MTRPELSPDQILIRRTARRITLQTAALFTVCLLALAVLAGVFILRTQNADGQRQLVAAVSDEDAVTDPPDGVVIYEDAHGTIKSSPQLNGRPLDPRALAAVTAGGPTQTGRTHRDHRDYQIRTARRGDAVVQAGLDLTNQNRERGRLITALFLAGVCGLVVALVIGSWIARRAVRPLELAAQRQRRFVADASHELRTPLTQAHTRAQILQRALAASGTQDDLAAEAGHMVRSTRQLADIIEELLVSAQLSADPTTVSPVDIGAVAADAADAEAVRAASRDVTIRVDRDNGPHVVPGSPTALRRVLNSLVDNAFGHIDDGGHITLTVERHAAGPTVICSVADDGHGFDPADAGHLFERFARGNHGDTRRFGLGLALVREVVLAHGGTITATAGPDHGATFTVELPAYPTKRQHG